MAAMPTGTRAVNNGVGLTPPLGWNSWCTDVECTKDICNEGMVKAQAEAIVSEVRRTAALP